MFLSFFFLTLISCGKVVEYCIYKTDIDLCNKVADEYIFQDEKFTKAFEKIAEKEEKFNGYDNVTIYIGEDLTDAAIDLAIIKDAHEIHLIGLDKNKQFTYILNQNGVVTLEKVYISNSYCVKDDSTEFFMDELHLSNVRWTGYEKKNCFYGGKLESDLLSIANNTFKFEEVKYKVNYVQAFYPNYKTDGAVFANVVTIQDFPNNASIYQYGDQLIIIPVNQETGFRRTNFRPHGDNNISINILHNHPNNQLHVGCFFSNKQPALIKSTFILEGSSLIIHDGPWSGLEEMSFSLQSQSQVIVNTSKIAINILSGSSESNVQFAVDFEMQVLDTATFDNVRFTGTLFKIHKLIFGKNKPFDLTASLTEIDILDANQPGTETALTGSAVKLHNITRNIKTLNVSELYLDDKLWLELGEKDSIPHIYADDVTITKKTTSVIAHHDYLEYIPEFTQDFIPFLTLTDEDHKAINLAKYINNTEFPFPLTIQGSQYGFTLEDYNKQRTHKYCYSIDGQSKCNVEKDIIQTQETSLEQILKDTQIPEEFYYLLNIHIYTDVPSDDPKTLTISSPQRIRKISIDCITPQSITVDLKTPDMFDNMLFEDCKLNIETDFTKQFTYILINNSELIGNTVEADFSFANIAEFDYYSYQQFGKALTPKNLIISSEKISFANHTDIDPLIPLENKNVTITIKNVSEVGGKNGFTPNVQIILDPQSSIHFTTNNYGNMTFGMKASHSPIDVIFKAVLPVDFVDPQGTTEYILHPNFYGTKLSINTTRMCTPHLKFDITGSEYLTLDDSSLDCNRTAAPSIKTQSTMEMPYIDGVISLEELSIVRQVYLNNNTFLSVKEFSNPDDDFLLYFNWTLDKVPFMHIKKYSTSQVTAFVPSIQSYIYPSDDDHIIRENYKIFKMGIPFLCIDESDFKGELFHDGLIFALKGKNITTSTIYMKSAQEAEAGTCMYFIPYDDPVRPPKSRGPANPTPWYVIPAVSLVILVALVISLVISFFKPKKKNEQAELSMNLLDQEE